MGTCKCNRSDAVQTYSEGLGNSSYFTCGLCILLSVSFIASLFIGRVEITPAEGIAVLKGWLTSTPELVDRITTMVFMEVRLPRCILVVMLGMGLAVSGAVYQAIFRNPLVSPDILGVSAGCTFGAALGLILPYDSFGLVRILSFCAGLLAVCCSMTISRFIEDESIIVLVLIGMVVTSVFMALLMVLKYFADPYSQLPAIVFWTMGSFHRAAWRDVYLTAPIVGCGLATVYLLRYKLNVLSLGDMQAKALGIVPGVYRFVFIVFSSLIVAMAVSTCGQIVWIGLVIPHIARALCGPNHEKMIPVTILIGGIFLLGADNAARSVTSAELPISIITALIGAPLFAFLLYRNRGSGWI